MQAKGLMFKSEIGQVIGLGEIMFLGHLGQMEVLSRGIAWLLLSCHVPLLKMTQMINGITTRNLILHALFIEQNIVLEVNQKQNSCTYLENDITSQNIIATIVDVIP
jgi:hypothetical protein